MSAHARHKLERLNEVLEHVSATLERGETAAPAESGTTLRRLDQNSGQQGEQCVASVDLAANVTNPNTTLTSTASASYTDFGPMHSNVELYTYTVVRDVDGNVEDSDSETVYGDAWGPGANAEASLDITFSRDGYAYASISVPPCDYVEWVSQDGAPL
ncbi:hypothetical protein [Arhodomonas sp. AD133]|uniref:hypothetical protein n=1 Tax=Arhodomonas sp. AD133 TaxID=3415009 RepID=UPI003EBD08EA